MELQIPTDTPRPAQVNAALLILRIASALGFLYHGSAILFGAFGGRGPQGFAAFMHMPAVVGYLVGLAPVCSYGILPTTAPELWAVFLAA